MHPTVDTLLQVHDLAPGGARALAHHVERCGECQAFLEMIDVVRVLDGIAPAPPDLELRVHQSLAAMRARAGAVGDASAASPVAQVASATSQRAADPAGPVAAPWPDAMTTVCAMLCSWMVLYVASLGSPAVAGTTSASQSLTSWGLSAITGIVLVWRTRRAPASNPRSSYVNL